jgi:hydrogenase maturation protease
MISLSQTSNKTLIVGLGNPLSGDDAFGSRVLEHLQQNAAALPPGAILLDAHTDLLNLIEDFTKYDRVLIIDAVLDPEGKLGPPGKITLLDETQFQSWPETSPSIHQMSPLLAIKLFRSLHPEAQTIIILIGLIIDQLTSEPRYALAEQTAEACEIIHKILIKNS